MIILVSFISIAYAQNQTNSSSNLSDQQINRDEGYGSDDQEYYEAEGINSESPSDEK